MMIKASSDHWVSRHDIARTIPGRDDSPEMIERCWEYLVERSSPTSGLGYTEAARSEVVAAKVRSSARGSASPHGVEERLAAQQETIDRLLAFVPKRSHFIEPNRLLEIMARLGMEAAELLPGSNPAVVEEPEADSDTPAFHRIAVTLSTPTDRDILDVARSILKLHKLVAEITSPDEFAAIRLTVDLR